MFFASLFRRPLLFAVVSCAVAVFAPSDFARAQTAPAATEVQPDRPDTIVKPKKRGFQWVANPQEVLPRSGKRNHIFYVGEPVTFELGPAADRFEIRNYQGDVVDQGSVKPAGRGADSKITSKVALAGWYKLYVYGKPAVAPKKKAADPLDSLLEGPKKTSAADEKAEQVRALWGDVVGATTFVLFRRDANFPSGSAVEQYGEPTGTNDQVFRAMSGMGPQRHQADAEDPDKAIAALERDIAIDQALYMNRDPVRPRPLMIAFGGGTKNLDGVRKIVEHFKDAVEYWEPRNEPNFGASPTDFLEKELKPFYKTIKEVSPKLKVIGPGTVSYNITQFGWIEGFLKAGGAKYLDGFSFHAYNCVNGDLFLARRTLNELNELLARYDADKLEKWQTEQGYFACIYGAYQPRLQGRWTMLEMMVYEQFGLPKEHNHLWYDRSHGFWDFPTWWENGDGSLNPAAPLMRVWSEELFGTKFERALDLGPNGNRQYIGSLFAGDASSGKRVAVFQAAGSTDGRVVLKVKTASADLPKQLRVSSAFGVETDVAVVDGRAEVPVGELPVYVRIAKGQEVEVEPYDWGVNLARAEGVKVAASGSSEHPSDKPDTPAEKRTPNDIGKLVNGEYENWYRTLQREDHPWMSNVAQWPATVELALPTAQKISRVVVFAAPPWQNQSTLVDYELQVEREGSWVTIERIKEPTQTLRVFSPQTRTTTDSFFSDRWVFEHRFEPVTASKVRLLVHQTTHGGGATGDVGEAGGQTGLQQIVLREIEIYGR
ncbi:MAG: hypothetical protein K8U03_02345 [Planctomycetia bacterium]|nr:hypothetical protein [Planctomycetia bacterium]